MSELETISITTSEGPVEVVRLHLLNGKNLYVGDDSEIIPLIKTIEPGTFYVLGATDATTKDLLPRVFKVVQNYVGSTIAEVKKGDLGLAKFISSCQFTLPKIPWAMMQILEAFFRKIDLDLGGSESIVVLTYDSRFSDSRGWGFVVPSQQNTAGHCKYDQESVIEIIPEDDLPYIRQVGTAHSHPGMSAFASHTDSGDQSNFDGIHITCGWSPNKGTEWYIEQQIAGTAWQFKVESVFDMPQAEISDDEYQTWSKRVTRPTAALPAAADRDWPSHYYSNYEKNMLVGNDGVKYSPISNAPISGPNITIIANITPVSAGCPFCAKGFLESDSVDNRRCMNCYTFLAFLDEEIEDIIRVRSHRGLDVSALTDTDKMIKFWRRPSAVDRSKDCVDVLQHPKAKKALPL